MINLRGSFTKKAEKIYVIAS